ncbi:hypothetical protein [Bacillus altitudinis]|uniref:hypothetical protein n=1 Tax=Bacillus altitudinis TaxID=293387 RepID=UPI00164373A4|nr:hypothetical protein [Bacillus altitudinis]
MNVFGEKKVVKEKKRGMIDVVFLYGFILVELGGVDFIMKGVVGERGVRLGGL